MPFYRSISALPKESHTHRCQTRTRFDNLPAMHRNHSSEPHNHYRKHLKKSAARYGRFQKTPAIKIPQKNCHADKNSMQYPRSSQPQSLHHHTSEHSDHLQL